MPRQTVRAKLRTSESCSVRSRSLRIECLEDRRLLAVIGNNISVGDELQHYRLAIAATAEYTTLLGGQTQALTAIQTFVSGINEIFEAELSIHFDLVSNLNTVFTVAGTDGYTNGNTSFMIDENTPILNGILGSSSYDIGHVFGTAVSGGSGLAGVGVVNSITSKGRGASVHSNPQGPDWVELVAHEIAHQFGALHSFNANAFGAAIGSRNASNAYEPASGSTMMSYAGISGADNLQSDADNYFHAASYEQIQTFIAGAGTPHSTTVTGNSVPTVSGGADFTIPASTPFELTAVGADSDSGNSLTYTWEQLDLGPAMSLPLSDNGSSPLFRSFEPTTASNRVFPRLGDLLNNVNTATIGEALPTTTRSLNFRATVRDGNGGVGSDDVLISVVNTGTPFAITSPNTAVNWTGGSSQTITWNVGGTDANGINTANVAIELSLDGGQTYQFDLASSTNNDGSHTLNVPNIDTTDARIRIRGIGNVFFDTSNANFSITSNAGAPGVTITESGGDTAVSEDGVVGGVDVDTYTLALNTAPAGTVSVTVTADAQTEVSLDGTSFFSSVVVAATSTSSQTIHVRAHDDVLLEGIHSGTITQTVTSSTDVNYPINMPINPVTVSIADDELQPVVGVDFDQSGSPPTNWTSVTDTFGSTTNNLIREDGTTSPYDLTVAVAGGANVVNTPAPTNLPDHTPSLSGLDGVRLSTTSLTLTWAGLSAGTDYDLYLFTAEPYSQNAIQTVTISGGGTNPAPFTMDTTAIGSSLLVNQLVASPSRTLMEDAVRATANGSGQIEVAVVNNGGDFVFLSGAAIQEVAAIPISADLSVTTHGHETGPVDVVYTVTLSENNDTGTAITFDLDDLLTGSAASGSDYTAVAANAQITVPAGASIGTLTVPVIDDTLLESSETVIAQISNPSAPEIVIVNASAIATIVDNDATLSIAAANAEQNEGDSGDTSFTFNVTRTGDTSGGASVDYAVTGDVDAGDFGGTLPNGTINFVTGETNKLITLQVSGDTDVEADENFTVTLSAASGATLGTLNASGIIQNDDVPPPSFAALDTNEDNSVDASTDGNLILVTLFGLPEANLTPFRGNTSLTNTQIADTIQQLKTDLTLDVNNDGMVDASTDGNLILVNLFGLPDANLTPFRGATTLTNVEIRQNIEALKIVPTAPLVPPSQLVVAADSKLVSADTLTQGMEEGISDAITIDASVQVGEHRLDLLSYYTFENRYLQTQRTYGSGDQTVRLDFAHRVPARTQIATDRINAIVDTVTARQTRFNSQDHHLVFAEFDDLFNEQIFDEILKNGEALAHHIDDLFAVI